MFRIANVQDVLVAAGAHAALKRENHQLANPGPAKGVAPMQAVCVFLTQPADGSGRSPAPVPRPPERAVR